MLEWIPKGTLADLSLWLNFLDGNHNGINLNLLTFREADLIFYSNTCPEGLGGFCSLELGKASPIRTQQ